MGGTKFWDYTESLGQLQSSPHDQLRPLLALYDNCVTFLAQSLFPYPFMYYDGFHYYQFDHVKGNSQSQWSYFWLCASVDVSKKRKLSFDLVGWVKKIYPHQHWRHSFNLRTPMEWFLQVGKDSSPSLRPLNAWFLELQP